MAKVGVLVMQELSKFLHGQHQTGLLGVFGRNLIRLAYGVLKNKYGCQVFELFDCLMGISQLLLSQLCIYNCTSV